MLWVGQLLLLILSTLVLETKDRYHTDLVSEALHNICDLTTIRRNQVQMCLRGTREIHHDGNATKKREQLLQHMVRINFTARLLIPLKRWFFTMVSFIMSHAFITLLFDRRNHLVRLILFLLVFCLWICHIEISRSWIIRCILLTVCLVFPLVFNMLWLIIWMLLFGYVHLSSLVLLLLF